MEKIEEIRKMFCQFESASDADEIKEAIRQATNWLIANRNFVPGGHVSDLLGTISAAARKL